MQLSIAPDGRLVITSEDTQALDLLEELIAQIAPRRPDYEIFRLKYADAFWVRENLEDFFTEEEEDKNSRTRYYFYDYAPKQDEKRSRLSQRKKLKFIYDLDTNSILVQGADLNQLRTIEELIAVYDVPEPADSQSARVS